MQLSDFIKPVPAPVYADIHESSPKSLINVIDIHTKQWPDIDDADLVILGVKEDRIRPEHAGVAVTPDEVRKELYKLFKPKYEVKIADIGNIEAGNSVNDTLFALNACLKELHERKKTVIILGGTADLAYSQFTSYEGTNPNLNVLVADAKIDLKQNETEPAYSNYLYKIITHQPNYLFNIVHLGNQAYYVEQESLDAFDKMNFDLFRLGHVRSKMQESEPLMRNADMVVFSMNSIKAADAGSTVEMNPNGFYGEEACQLARYAGMSNDLSSIGFYDLNAFKDLNAGGSKLLSQMLWYFIDGYYNRKNDYPSSDNKDYTIYRTSLKTGNYEIVFYKNRYNERWWMEVPYPKERSVQKGTFMVPCSYSDYQAALNDEIPDRWMRAYQKLL
ncbi:MAG: formimidoylglutamase [Bacteroidota bacterium]